MPSREPELYKDKIEVSLDGRQIFYLFFGGAVIAGLVFVLGVMVGRRVEARGHLDCADRAGRSDPQAVSDPLAALDRLERADNLSYHGALTGSDAPTDVEKAIAERASGEKAMGDGERRRASGHGDKPASPPSGDGHAARGDGGARPAPARPDGDPRAEAHPAPSRPDGEPRAEAHPAPVAERTHGDKRETDKPDKREAEKREADKPDKREADKKSHKRDDAAARSEHPDGRKTASRDEPVTRPERSTAARADSAQDARDRSSEAREGKRDDRSDGKSEGKSSKSEGKVRFTLQLSSFQDRGEAEAFLGSVKASGFQAYLTEADIAGKGTFYRVRLGSFRSLEAASDAKAEYEKSAKKTAQIMRL